MCEEISITNPMKAIRAKCLDCCCGQRLVVEECSCEDCPLHPFRLGKNPYRKKREMSEEQKEAAKQRMQNYWKDKGVDQDE